MGKVVNMGEHFSINLIFSEEMDTTEALPHLFGNYLKGFFNPVSVFYGFVDKKGEYFKGVIGEEPESLGFDSPKFEKEGVVEDLHLTKYNGNDCLDDLIKIISSKSIDKGILKVYGTTNIFYQKNSEIFKDWYLREKKLSKTYIIEAFKKGRIEYSEYFSPILEIGLTNPEKFRILHFNPYGDVFLKNREAIPISNLKAGELNFSELTEKISKFCNRYIEYLQTVEYTFEGEKYSKERDWMEQKLKSIPKFSGFV